MTNRKLTLSMVRKLALTCSSRTEFFEKDPSAYQWARANNKLDIWFKKSNKKKKHTKNKKVVKKVKQKKEKRTITSAINEVKSSYNSKKELLKKDRALYNYLARNKQLDKLNKLFKKEKIVKIKKIKKEKKKETFSLELLQELMRQCQTKGEFQTKYPKEYSWAYRKKIIKDLYKYLPKKEKNLSKKELKKSIINGYSKEEILQLALSYPNRKDFIINEPKAFAWAKEHLAPGELKTENEHLKLVLEQEANSLCGKNPNFGRFKEDLIGAGTVAYFEAKIKIDKKKSTLEAWSYLRQRISGAMIDFVRDISNYNRSQFDKQKKIEQAAKEFFKENKKEATNADLAKSLKMSMDDLYQLKRKAIRTNCVSDVQSNANNESFNIIDNYHYKNFDDKSIMFKGLFSQLDQFAEREFSDQEYQIFYYCLGLEEKNLDVANMMNISGIHVAVVLKKIKEKLANFVVSHKVLKELVM